jgi:1,4-dihydroxy-2-naphthoyl-CoA synthase
MSVVLNQFAPKPNADVVEFLERILQQARAGELVGTIILTQGTDGHLHYAVAGIHDRFQVTGWLFNALVKLQDDA